MLPRAPTSKLVVRNGSECHGHDPNAANIVEWRVVKKRQSGLQTVALASIFLVRRLPCLGNKCLVVSLFSSPCALLHPCPKHSTSLPGHLDEALANAATQSACPALLPAGRSRSQPALLCKIYSLHSERPSCFFLFSSFIHRSKQPVFISSNESNRDYPLTQLLLLLLLLRLLLIPNSSKQTQHALLIRPLRCRRRCGAPG